MIRFMDSLGRRLSPPPEEELVVKFVDP